MPDFIDKNAFLKDALPDCKYPDALIAAVEKQPIVHIDDMAFKIQNAIQAAKPSGKVEVTFVRHGRWNYRHEDDWCYCTSCGTDAEGSDGECLETDYCPHCGARMDGGADNG